MNIKNEKGIALIMSIGIVAMLAIIGTTFAINMRLEQKAAANYLANIKAKTLAEAGIDHAIAVLRLYAITQAYSDIDDEWRWYGTAIKLYGTSDYSGAYEVNAIDCASRIYINDGLYLTGTSKSDRETRLATMLQNLGAAIDNINGTDPAPIGALEGDEIINYRNSMGGFVTKEQIKETDWGGSGKIINATDYRWLKNYITVNAWVDPDTIRPLGSAATPEVQARAPVNVNTASWTVLVAVLQGVSTGEVITSGEAGNVADSIISQSNVRPFTNWNGALLTGGFNTYINDQVPALITQTKADIIKANANPNTKLNRLNPNSSWKAQALADKTELTTLNTTEFCFGSMGYYELESIGTVTIGTDRVAQKKVKAVVKLYDLWRQTTQAQFEAGTKTYVSTYPEFDPGDTDIPNSPSPWDGQIMIKKDSMGFASGVLFRASFIGKGTPTVNNDDFDAQDGAGSKTATPSAGLTESSIFSAGDLYSDGVKIDGTDILSYSATSNIQVPGTVEMWIKPYYTSGTHYFFRWNDGAGRYIDLYDNAGALTARFSDGATTITDTTPGSLTSTPGEWRHIAATWATPSTSEVEIFVDGSTNGKTTSVVAITAPSGGTIYIGSDNVGSNQAYATIGEVRIWNTQKWTAAFTPDDLYQETASRTFESSSSPSIGTGRRLGTISWTESIPSGDIQFGIDPAGGSSFSGTYGNDGGSETSIGKAGGSSVLNTDTTGANIKYKATLSSSGTPLKDTPVLDDVTITYLSPVRFFSWQEVTE